MKMKQILRKIYTAMCAVAAFQQQGYMFVDQPFMVHHEFVMKSML